MQNFKNQDLEVRGHQMIVFELKNSLKQGAVYFYKSSRRRLDIDNRRE